MPGLVRRSRGVRGPRPCGAGPGAAPLRRRPAGPGRRVLPLRQVPLRPGPGADAGGAPAGRPLPGRRAPRPGSPWPPGDSPPRVQRDGGRPSAAEYGWSPPGGGPHRGAGLGQGGVPVDGGALPGARPGHVRGGRPGAGGGRVCPPDPPRLGGARGGDPRRPERAARHRRRPRRSVGRQPRRVLRPALGQRRRQGPGLHRAGGPIRLRRGVGSPPRPHPRGLPSPGALRVGRRGGAAGRADRIRAPLQIVFGKQDRLIPWAQAARLAREASGPVDLLLFEDGNHVCTNISWHHRLRSADWMAEQLRARPHG